MSTCVRTGCDRPALAVWWLLCAGCTLPLTDHVAAPAASAVEQQHAAGWDAVEWAERIAPGRWGHAKDDGWVADQRCLAFASVVTGRATGCPHTVTDTATPVVAVVRAPGVLRCPACAEPAVAATTTSGHACDRCGSAPTGVEDRVAGLVGSSLVLVAQLCSACTGHVMAVPGVVSG